MSGELDSWAIDRDGVRYQIDLDPDYEANARPADQGDTYSPADLQAHADGLWSFVGVSVTPIVNGIDDAYPWASLWGVEYGTMPAETEPHQDGQHGETVIGRESIEADFVSELVSEVRAELRKLRDTLQALPLDDCEATHLRTEGIPQPVTVRCDRAAGHAPPHRVMSYEWTAPAPEAPAPEAPASAPEANCTACGEPVGNVCWRCA